jgi:hypothetical protein
MSSGSMVLVDAAGRRRSPQRPRGISPGRAPHNKGIQYPPDPPRPEEIIVVMRQAGHDRHGLRPRALIAVLWRAGLRIREALALNETDVDTVRGSLLIRHGKGDKRREAGMDQFRFERFPAWKAHRVSVPVGPLFCVTDGPTRGRRWAATAARCELRQLAAEAGVRRRFAPHQLRGAHAVELAREGVAVNIIQRRLRHTDLGTRRLICRASTLQRSSTLSDRDASQPSQRRRASRSDSWPPAVGERLSPPVSLDRPNRHSKSNGLAGPATVQECCVGPQRVLAYFDDRSQHPRAAEWEADFRDTPARSRALGVGAAAGARDLGAAIYELQPGGAVSPHHLHRANEELLIVLSLVRNADAYGLSSTLVV